MPLGPRTFVSDLINGGVYILNAAVLARLPEGKASMNELLPTLASEGQLFHFESQGYWVKMTDVATFLSAVGPQLDMMRLLTPQSLAPSSGPPVPDESTLAGNVLIDDSATIGNGCKIGPNVVIGLDAPRPGAAGFSVLTRPVSQPPSSRLGTVPTAPSETACG